MTRFASVDGPSTMRRLLLGLAALPFGAAVRRGPDAEHGRGIAGLVA